MQRRQKERSGHMEEGNKISDIIVKSIHKQAMKETETEKGSYWYFLKYKHIRSLLFGTLYTNLNHKYFSFGQVSYFNSKLEKEISTMSLS